MGATTAVTFTVTFRAKAIYFNDLNTVQLPAACTRWHFKACLDRTSYKSTAQREPKDINGSSLGPQWFVFLAEKRPLSGFVKLWPLV